MTATDPVPSVEAAPACSDYCVHAQEHQAMATIVAEMREYLEAGLSEEDVLRYVEDYSVGRELIRASVSFDEIIQETGQVGGGLSGVIRKSLRTGKAETIRAAIEGLSDLALEKYGFEPTVVQSQYAVLAVAFAVAINQRFVDRTGHGKTTGITALESTIVNGFTSNLLSRISTDNLCTTYASHFREERQEGSLIGQMVGELNGLFNEAYAQGVPMHEDYLYYKVMFFMNQIARVREIEAFAAEIDEPETEVSPEELRPVNNEFAEQIRRLRSYEVAPVLFDLGAEGANRRAVYRQGRDFAGLLPEELRKFSDSSLATLGVVTAENDNPFELKAVPIAGDSQRFFIEGMERILRVDLHGELWGNIPGESPGIQLKLVFERLGHSTKYELLRSRILSQVFDATAPATIVEQLNRLEVSRDNEEDTRQSSDRVVYGMLLPRVRYMRSPIGQIRKDFAGAFKTEEREAEAKIARRLRRHTVSGHLRKIPAGSKPSAIAILKARAAYEDEDYELPEGYTFVSRHERGDESKGRVIGHRAVSSVLD